MCDCEDKGARIEIGHTKKDIEELEERMDLKFNLLAEREGFDSFEEMIGGE